MTVWANVVSVFDTVDGVLGATTPSITAPSMITHRVMTLSITALRMLTVRIMTVSKMILSITVKK
jgi:hypothetical protein